MTTTTTAPTDAALLAAFERCTLDPSEFTHRNHVRVAWLYLREHPLLEALTRFAAALRRYTASLGKEALYHETITFAFMFVIHERMQRSPFESFDSFDAFAAAHPDLFAKPTVLERYYRAETLGSELARRAFVMPDCAARCS